MGPIQLLFRDYRQRRAVTIVSGQLFQHDITLVSVYAPNTDSPEFFHNLHSKLVKLNSVHIILGGDLNLIIDTSLDSTKHSVPTKPWSLKAFGELCESLSLIDRWRQCNPHAHVYTHYSGQYNTWNRLDYWWMTPDICMWYSSIVTLPSTYSDHSPVLLQLLIPRPAGYERQWRFPGRTLQD